MTEAEYDARLREWSMNVHMSARSALVIGTHATGHLAESIHHFVDRMKDGDGRHIAFRFDRYGVFRHYGAGKGWVIVNGVPVPGYRIVPMKLRYGNKNMKLWNSQAQRMLQKGYSAADVRNAKNVFLDSKSGRKREPLDWLDGRIQAGVEELGDIAQAYWGDLALLSLGQQIQGAKIVK